jgi:hypothetical protein
VCLVTVKSKSQISIMVICFDCFCCSRLMCTCLLDTLNLGCWVYTVCTILGSLRFPKAVFFQLVEQ